MTTKPIRTWDGTLSCEHFNDNNQLKDALMKIAKNFAFQRERSESGYEHYQIRIRLEKLSRFSAMVKLFDMNDAGYLKKAHWTPTATKSSKTFNYVLKCQTRVAGPWTEQNLLSDEDLKIETVRDNPYNWQKSILEEIKKEANDRNVNVICNEEGNIGKSTFCRFLGIRKLACVVPPYNDSSKIMGWIATRKDHPRCYVFDLPRGISAKAEKEIYSTIECLKNGRITDWRYAGTDIWIKIPHIWVFKNGKPRASSLSKDRWKLWHIDQQELKELL